MKSIPTLFFATAVLAAICGMIWGIQMAATGDHLLSPAHGHLNLIGFVVMAVSGTYYALTPAAAASRLARTHYILLVITVLLLAPGIALAITERTEALALIGSLFALGSMLLFGYIVLKFGVSSAPLNQARS